MGLTIAGVNFDAYLTKGSLRHLNALNSEPDTLDFMLIAGAPKPAIGSEVIYTLPDGSRLFGGVLAGFPETPVGFMAMGYACTCVDWRPRADRRLVNDRYVSKTAGTIIKEAFAKYAPEFDTSLVDVGGSLIASIRFKDGARLTAVLDRLADLTGWVWDIDPMKRVLWAPMGAQVAPMELTDTSRNFKKLEVSINRDELRNVVVVKGGKYPKATSTTDRYTGDGVTTRFRLTQVPHGTEGYLVLQEDFPSLDLSRWVETDVSNPTPPAGHISSDGYLFTTIQQGAALAESGALQVVGGNGVWGGVRLQSYGVYGRGDGGRRFEWDVFVDATGKALSIGLWDPSNLADVNGSVYAFRFRTDGYIQPLEAGVQYTPLTAVPYTTGDQIRLRIIPKATSGATYWVNKDAANGFQPSQWVKLYDSSYSSLANLTVTPVFNFDFVGRVDRVRVYNRLLGIVLKVAGVEKTIGLLNVDEDAGVDALIGAPVNDLPVLAFFGDSKPANGASVELTYFEGIPVKTQARDAASIAAIAALEGHDGIYEHEIVDPTLDTLALARLRATQDLEQYANPITTLTYKTRSGGLRAGQVVSAKLTTALTGRVLAGSFLIQQVETASLGLGNFEYTVTASSKLKGLGDYLSDLLRKGRRSDVPDDDNSPIDEFIWAEDTLTLTDSGSVTGPEVTTSDTLEFTDLGSVEAGPVGPFVYGPWPYLEDFEGFALDASPAWFATLGTNPWLVKSYLGSKRLQVPANEPGIIWAVFNNLFPLVRTVSWTSVDNGGLDSPPHPGVVVAWQDANNYDAVYTRASLGEIVWYKVRAGAATGISLYDGPGTFANDQVNTFSVAVNNDGNNVVTFNGTLLPPGTGWLTGTSRIGVWGAETALTLGFIDNIAVTTSPSGNQARWGLSSRA